MLLSVLFPVLWLGKSSLYLVKSRCLSRGTPLRTAARGLTLLFLSLSLSLRLTLFFSRSLALSLSRESAAILYIAKSFTISLGTFIIPQLNPPCFVAERYCGRFNLSFHLAPDYPPDYTIPTTLLFPLPPPRLVQNVLLRSSVLVRLSPNHPKLTARRNEILFSD